MHSPNVLSISVRSPWDRVRHRVGAFADVSTSYLSGDVHLANSRIQPTRGGMIAPILGGTLLTVDHSFPVYASIVIFILAGLCVIFLEEHEGDRSGERVLAH